MYFIFACLVCVLYLSFHISYSLLQTTIFFLLLFLHLHLPPSYCFSLPSSFFFTFSSLVFLFPFLIILCILLLVLLPPFFFACVFFPFHSSSPPHISSSSSSLLLLVKVLISGWSVQTDSLWSPQKELNCNCVSCTAIHVSMLYLLNHSGNIQTVLQSDVSSPHLLVSSLC